MKKQVMAGFIIVCLFFVCGCATYSNDTSSKTAGLLEPSSALKFSDVPVPAGFKLMP